MNRLARLSIEVNLFKFDRKKQKKMQTGKYNEDDAEMENEIVSSIKPLHLRSSIGQFRFKLNRLI